MKRIIYFTHETPSELIFRLELFGVWRYSIGGIHGLLA